METMILKWLKKARFLIVFFCINMILSFLLEPARGASEIMWSSYYEQDALDTIFIGSSLCKGTFDPYIFDERLGVNSYNMGTPLQAVPQTVRALEVALKEHEIDTVIFGMGFSTLKYEGLTEAQLTFEKARARERGGLAGIAEDIRFLFSEEVRGNEKSIQYLFPWLYNREEISLDMIKRNVSLKIRQMKEKYFGIPIEDNQVFHKGYQNHGGMVVNYDNRWENNSYRYYDAALDAEMMKSLEEMIQICRQHEVDFMIINTPHPYFDVIACYESYEQNQHEVKTLCEKYGVDYYDFSLAKPEIFASKPEYYSDYEHLNLEGSQVFCQQLCDFLIRREKGEDMDAYFYSVDEFLDIHAEWLEDWKAYYW